MKSLSVDVADLPEFALKKYEQSVENWGEGNVDCVMMEGCDDVFFFKNPSSPPFPTVADYPFTPIKWEFGSTKINCEDDCVMCGVRFVRRNDNATRILVSPFFGRCEVVCRDCFKWRCAEIRKRKPKAGKPAGEGRLL